MALEDQFKREFSIKASRLGRKCDAQAKENERLQEEINLLQEEHAKELDAVRQRYQTMSEQSNNQLIMEQQASLSEGAYIKDAFSQLQVTEREDKKSNHTDINTHASKSLDFFFRFSNRFKKRVGKLNRPITKIKSRIWLKKLLV